MKGADTDSFTTESIRARASAHVARVLPGHREVWLGAAAVIVIASIFGARFLSARTASLTGTNSVGVATVVANATSGHKVCVRDLDVPARTGRISISIFALQLARGARLRAYVSTRGVRLPLKQSATAGALTFLPFTLPRPLKRDLTNASLCVTPLRMTVGFGGAFVQRLPTAPVTTVAGKPLVLGDIGVRYLRPEGQSPRVSDAIPAALRRSNVFESGFGGVLTWLALPALLLLIYVTVRVSATAEQRTLRSLAITGAAITFIHGAAWAVLLHPFHGADESEHFAYAQYLAETNERADAGSSDRPSYATSQLRLMEALHHNSTILNSTSRPRWEPLYAAEYERQGKSSRDDDGGGFTTGASGHSPLYYAIIGLPYRVFHAGADLPSVMLTMRLLNALMAGLIAALAVLTAGLILGGQRGVAWLAGVLTGLQPVFGSVAGAINNDTAVNLVAATMVYCLIRAWKNGPTSRNAITVGILVILLPVAKITGFAIVPAVGVAAVVIAINHSVRDALRWASLAALSALIVASIWLFALAPALGGSPGTLVNQHPAAPSAVGAAPPGARISLGTRANYLLQTFVPSPTFGKDHWKLSGAGPLERWPAYAIYVDRGYGLFGWKSVEPSRGLLHGVFLWLLIGWALCLAAAVRHRRSWRSWVGGALILACTVPLVVAFVSYAFATDEAVTEGFGEQGRYVFTALVPLAVMFSTASLSFTGRMRRASLGAMTAAASSLATIAWASALRGWFT